MLISTENLKDGTTKKGESCSVLLVRQDYFFIHGGITMKNTRFFTSESITEGHPDKVCDKIADNILDAIIGKDKNARVAVEVAINVDTVFVFGQITTTAKVNFEDIVRKTIKKIGYTKENGFDADNCKIILSIEKQSPDIAMGVDNALEHKQGGAELDKIGAGDQGLMFGYASDETEHLMPLATDLANNIAYRLQRVRKTGEVTYLRPDGKCQVTVEYVNKRPKRVDTVVLSTQHDENVSLEQLKADMVEKVIKQVVPAKLIDENTKYLINPTGKFVLGGPGADSGLTGRKIIVDTYGAYCQHGGGSFSGKDPTKVDRSAAYMARYVCKNVVGAGLAKKIKLHLSYAIGKANPVSVDIDTYGTGKIKDSKIVEIINQVFDLRPLAIIRQLDLLKPIYSKTVNYGHFGKDGFPWEKLDKVDQIKELAK